MHHMIHSLITTNPRPSPPQQEAQLMTKDTVDPSLLELDDEALMEERVK
jgi:hypothetical protein